MLSIPDLMQIPREELTPGQLEIRCGVLLDALETARASYDALSDPPAGVPDETAAYVLHVAELNRAAADAAYAAERTYWKGIRDAVAGPAATETEV
jgi:hypothetical protein